MTDAPRTRIPIAYTAAMLVAGVLGLFAAFQLTVDKFAVLENPSFVPSCSISPIVECTTNLNAPQGAVFGFPNPLIGIIGWSVVIAVIMGIIAGARYARWFWALFNVGLLAAVVFCIWLMTQSFLVIGKICIWCVLTWAVSLLAFVITTGLNLSRGVLGAGGRSAGRFVLRWSPLIVLVLYLVIAVLGQLRWDLIGFLVHGR